MRTTGTRISAQALVATSLVAALLASPVAAEEPDIPNVIEACYSAPYSPDQRLPFSTNQEEWCHPLFEQIEATTKPGGVVTVSWTPASRHVYWYCGPGYARQNCPINEYRLEADNYGEPVRCSTDSAGTACTLRGLGTLYSQPISLSAYLANGNWFRVHLVVEPCCKSPSAPPTVAAVATQNSIDVSWAASDYWGGARELTYVVTTEPPSTTCTTSGLACRLETVSYGQTYSVLVSATNAAGSSAATRTSIPVFIAPSTPSAPRNIKVRSKRGGAATVIWEAPESVGGSPVEKYVVTTSPSTKKCVSKAGARSCSFRKLPGGKTYSFSVQAVNAQGRGMTSLPVSLTVRKLRQQPPTSIVAVPSSGSISVSWAAARDASKKNRVRYVVETADGSATCVTRGTGCTLSGLAAGATYQVNVVARSRRGTSVKSSASATIPIPRVEPPKPVLQIG